MSKGEPQRNAPAQPADLRERMHALPLPLAQLVRRAYNGKSAADRHGSAFYLAECTLKLAASARIGVWLDRALKPASEIARRLEVLALPSTGHWCELFREVSIALGALPDAALVPLAAQAQEVARKRPDWTGVRAFAERSAAEGLCSEEVARQALRRGLCGFFDLLVAYRNDVVGHGAQRSERFYEELGALLLDALAEVLGCPALFAGLTLAQARLETERGGVSTKVVWVALSGLAGLPREGDASGAIPGHLYFIDSSARVPLHPLAVYQHDDDFGREQVGFLNRTVRRTRKAGGNEVSEIRRADYLDYSSGQTLTGLDAREALAALFSRLSGKQVSRSEVDTAADASHAETPAEPSEDVVTAGKEIGDFELLGEIGRGSMGVVYKARQLSLGRIVALKVLPPALAADPAARQRFRKEIAALGRCDHPNVVKILASGSDGDRVYYAMEYVDGADLGLAGTVLSSWKSSRPSLKEGHLPAAVATSARSRSAGAEQSDEPSAADVTPPPVITAGRPFSERVTELFADAADGLDHLHQNGILHRDLKPGNLMLTAGGRRIVIMDLGLAKLKDESKALTSSDIKILGTLRYMAPEQLQRRLLDVDERADIYGLGATLYELVTGRAIFDGDTEQRLIHQVLQEEPMAPHRVDRSLSVDLSTVIQTAIHKSRDRRYSSARAFAEDLRAVAAHRPIKARRPGIVYRGWLWTRRNRPLAALGACLTLAACGGAAYWNHQRLRVSYHDRIVERAGIYQGVNTVSGPEGRWNTYRFLSRGGRLIAIESVNGLGRARDDNEFSSTRYSYDDDGAITQRIDRSKTGQIKVKLVYSKKGAHYQILRLDRNDFPSPEAGDASMRRHEYDGGGYLKRMLFNDRGSPRPILGVYGHDFVRNDHGMPVELTFLSADGKPSARLDGVARATMRYNDNDEMLEQAYFDTAGRPVLNASGYAMYRAQYDAHGNEVERSFYGTDGKLILQRDGQAVWRFKYDEHGNLLERSAFGTDGQAVLLRFGFSIYRARFDDAGNEIERAHFDSRGAPVWIREGFSTYRCRYDAQGRETERAFFGPAGEPALNRGGYATLRTSYDDRGNIAEHASFGTSGEPILLKEGRAVVRLRHDDRDNEVERAYFDTKRAPVIAKDGCALWRMKYNDRGKEIEKACLDTAEEPRIGKDGWATVRTKYDEMGKPVERAYLGPRGEPILQGEGYATIRSQYDDRGNEVEQAYFGVAAEAVAIQGGYAMWRGTFDDRGRITQHAYFGSDGRPVLCDQGYSIRRLKYDDRGNPIETVYLDASARPVVIKAGHAIVRAAFDERNREIERRFLGAAGEPAVQGEPYATQRCSYDERGNEVERRFFGPDDMPAATKDGAVRWEARYDELGNEVERKLFNKEGKLITPGR
jgi:YD repeat-containing protein